MYASDMEISETVGWVFEMCTDNTASVIQGLTTGAIIINFFHSC